MEEGDKNECGRSERQHEGGGMRSIFAEMDERGEMSLGRELDR